MSDWIEEAAKKIQEAIISLPTMTDAEDVKIMSNIIARHAPNVDALVEAVKNGMKDMGHSAMNPAKYVNYQISVEKIMAIRDALADYQKAQKGAE